MSDKQPEENQSEEITYRGGWKQPENIGGWKKPEDEPETPTGGWKTVRAMPLELESSPAEEGAWHLPRPEDTPFGPEDEIQISDTTAAMRPEDMVFGEAEQETEATTETVEEDLEELTEDLETYSGLGELVATLSSVTEEQPAPSLLIGEDEDEDEETLEAEEAELDFGDVTGPEREALTQAIADEGDEATEMLPSDQARQPSTELVDLEEEAEEGEAVDPAEIARRRIAELQGESPEAEAEPELHDLGDTMGEEAGDAADVARQRVAELMGEAPAEEEAPESELERKFRETKTKVLALRQQYHNGTLTRDQLQEELRKYMVLDDNDVWWMMGVESDTWYRYDKNTGSWVVATPPVDLSERGPATVTSEFTPSDVINGQLPYLPDDDEQSDSMSGDTAYTRADTEPFDADSDMPLPRAGTPIYDPDHTVPSMAAINQDTIRFSEADTLDPTRRFEAGETVISRPTYQPAAGYAAEETPEYEDVAVGEDIYQQAVERQRQSTLRRALLITSLIIGSIFIIGSLVVLYMVFSYNNIAALYTGEVEGLANYQPNFQTVEIRDVNGDLLTELNSQDGGRRVSVSLSQMSPELIFAVVGTEDERFYENPGFDPFAIARAFLQNLRAGNVVSGASTITQQVAGLIVPNQGLNPAEQKLHEIIIASEIARTYDKNFILELYMNEVFFGNQSYGVEAASEFYFDKDAAEINLSEGALLTSFINSPSVTPVTQEVRDQSFDNMDAILRGLSEVGCLNFQHPSNHPQYTEGEPFCISRSQIVQANNEFTGRVNLQRAEIRGAEYLPINVDNDYPHFVQYINNLLSLEYGDEMFREGFIVTTTLVPRIHMTAQDVLRQQLANNSIARGLQTGSIMVVDPTNGHIMAMVGSPDFNNSDISGQVNGAFTWQQPGSTIKPVVYGASFEGVGDRNGNQVLDYNEYFTAATVLWDVPTQFQDPAYAPVNADGRFRGPVSIRSALANSLNVPAVKAYNFIGNERFIDTAQRLGLTFLDEAQFGLPTALGATEVRLYDMMQAYSVLANTGRYVPLRAITRITTADGIEVPLRGRLEPQEPAAVMQPNITFLLQNILADNNARLEVIGGSTPLYLPEFDGAIAAKTGTTADARDVWTMGFSRNTVVGVWLGRPDNRETQATSLEAAAPIFNTVMRASLEGRTRPGAFASPGNTVSTGSVISEVICNYTGALPTEACTERRNELFAADRPPPPAEQGAIITIPIDTWTGLRANQYCQDNIQNRTFVDLFPSDPWAVQWLASGAGQSTAQRMGLPIPPEAPPGGACDVNTILPTVRITNPSPNQTVTETVQITGVVSAQNFDRYQIELAPVNSNTFTIIAGPFQSQQPNLGSVLAEWDSRDVSNGQYTLRLSVFATQASGGGFLRRDVPIVVENIPPTPTPTMTPTATQMVVPSPTTLPFPTTGPFPTSAIEPVATQPFSEIPFEDDIFESQDGVPATPTIVIGGG